MLGLPSALFLDHVTEPQNFNPVLAPLDLLVSELFLALESVNSDNKAPFNTVSDKKSSIIEKFIKTWRTHFGSNIYPAVRLVFPNRDGRKYYIKDVALTRLVVKLLNLQKGLADYAMIQSWKKQFHAKSRLVGDEERRSVGDLPLLISRIMLRRRNAAEPVKTSVSVEDVNRVLDTLTEKTQSADQVALLDPFLAKLTIPEVRFFFLIILKESMLSFFERSFFLAWHPDAYDLFKVCSNMKLIFWRLSDPQERLLLSQKCVQLMHQFVPQSSKKLDISYDSLCQKMTAPMSSEGKDPRLMEMYQSSGSEGHFLIEEKLDGDRMLMHMANGRFLWHTRRRRDYTLVYGENVHIGSLTKHLAGAFPESVKSIVLDGEMVAWSKERNCLLPFGTLRSAAIQEALKQFDIVDVYEGNNAWPFFIVFDILHLNGQDLTNLPLFYRKQLLTKVVREVPHRLETLQWVLAKTPADLKANMQKIVSESNEGIMVKLLLSKYRVYSRDSTWIKVKPEYLESFGENLDLVVIGKIGRVKTSYVCGLRDDEDEGTYKLFCSVANGFSNAVYRQIEAKLCNFWVDFRDRKPSPELLKFGTKKPDFWINPANSIVLEIKARSIEATAETPYAAGSTLHNNWCRSVREDKNYDECISLQEYQDLKLKYSRDIFKSQAVNRDRKRDYQNSIYEKYNKPKGQSKRDKKSTLFSGLKFIIATDHHDAHTERTIPVDEIKQLVRDHRGENWIDLHKKDPQVLNTIIVGEITTPRLSRWIDEGFDVIRPDWIYACVSRDRILPLEPIYVYFANSLNLELKTRERVDEFGDSFATGGKSPRGFLAYLAGLPVPQQATRDLLTTLARDAGFQIYDNHDPETVPHFDPPLVHRTPFCGVTFYIVLGAEFPDVSRICDRIRRFGGIVTQNINSTPGFIVMPQALIDNGSAKNLCHRLLQDMARNFTEATRLAYIVGEPFLAASIQAGELADPSNFRVDNK